MATESMHDLFKIIPICPQPQELQQKWEAARHQAASQEAKLQSNIREIAYLEQRLIALSQENNALRLDLVTSQAQVDSLARINR